MHVDFKNDVNKYIKRHVLYIKDILYVVFKM